MFCEKCNIEYDGDAVLCKKCGRRLIEFTHIIDPDELDDLAALSDEAEDREATGEAVEDVVKSTGPSLLITVADQEEADDIADLLESNNIPALKKENREAGDILNDGSGCAYDIFVPYELYPDALQLVTEKTGTDTGSEDLSDEELDRMLEEMAGELGANDI